MKESVKFKCPKCGHKWIGEIDTNITTRKIDYNKIVRAKSCDGSKCPKCGFETPSDIHSEPKIEIIFLYPKGKIYGG